MCFHGNFFEVLEKGKNLSTGVRATLQKRRSELKYSP